MYSLTNDCVPWVSVHPSHGDWAAKLITMTPAGHLRTCRGVTADATHRPVVSDTSSGCVKHHPRVFLWLWFLKASVCASADDLLSHTSARRQSLLSHEAFPLYFLPPTLSHPPSPSLPPTFPIFSPILHFFVHKLQSNSFLRAVLPEFNPPSLPLSAFILLWKTWLRPRPFSESELAHPSCPAPHPHDCNHHIPTQIFFFKFLRPSAIQSGPVTLLHCYRGVANCWFASFEALLCLLIAFADSCLLSLCATRLACTFSPPSPIQWRGIKGRLSFASACQHNIQQGWGNNRAKNELSHVRKDRKAKVK